jgi:hypothetical protein
MQPPVVVRQEHAAPLVECQQVSRGEREKAVTDDGTGGVGESGDLAIWRSGDLSDDLEIW